MSGCPYTQSEHDDAVGTGCLLLMLAAIPVVVAFLTWAVSL